MASGTSAAALLLPLLVLVLFAAGKYCTYESSIIAWIGACMLTDGTTAAVLNLHTLHSAGAQAGGAIEFSPPRARRAGPPPTSSIIGV
jgi:hypothetical protein